ncbi:MAG: class I SAM-dependent DNA methyltransferase [Planctomycetota bacterium]
MKTQFQDKVNDIFEIANNLRGPYRPNQYGRVILPMTVLRRLDCVLEPTREKVQKAYAKHEDKSQEALEKILNKAAGDGFQFHNVSKLDFRTLAADPTHLAQNLIQFIESFSPKARRVLKSFKFHEQIEKLDESNRLYLVVKKFSELDLHPDRVPNQEMGYIFEELIRKYNEDANETAGDHFTPREVIRLMVNILFTGDGDRLSRKRYAPSIYDPTCGTGGMLAAAEDYLHESYPDARPELFGQDFNPESYAICGSDMLIKGHSIEHIVFGDVLGDGKTGDGFPDENFDYMVANPPFGVEWKPEKDSVWDEFKNDGFSGRFGAGTPAIDDGSFLFLQHMISKMKPVNPDAGGAASGGSRIAIVFNGSPLFSGDAVAGEIEAQNSAESNIRRWILQNDWLEAIIALPNQLFYNTGIFTYLWIVTNRKPEHRRGRVQLINAVDFYIKMTKSLGDKRNRIGEPTEDEPDLPGHVGQITRVYADFRHDDERTIKSNGGSKSVVTSKIFDNTDFAYRKITVERPLRLRFEITEEGIDRLKTIKAFENLAISKKKNKKERQALEAAGVAFQESIIELLHAFPAGKVWMNREQFLSDLMELAKTEKIKLNKGPRDAIVKAIGQRDPEAEICHDKHGDPEPDPELRDTEYVPYKRDIDDYFDAEVKPYVSDAWIDRSKTDAQDGQVGIVGYEIPLNRHFYVYEPPRPLSEIEAEIAELEKSIVNELREVVAS